MPELPELEVICEVLNRRLSGRSIDEVTIAAKGGPLVVRDLTGGDFLETLAHQTIGTAHRRGKFLLLSLSPSELSLAINPKLSGRLQLCPPRSKKAGPVLVTLHFSKPDEELRYVDRKKMGQLYLTNNLAEIPTFSEMGPGALDISYGEFESRLKSFRGEIKGILARERFVSGIGNAYADEILWAARLHPFRKRPTLSPEEMKRLFEAMRRILLEGVEKVRVAMGENIHLKPRDFFSVHLRGGEPCPRCTNTISEITANQRITNFCRTCQPGGLIRGM